MNDSTNAPLWQSAPLACIGVSKRGNEYRAEFEGKMYLAVLLYTPTPIFQLGESYTFRADRVNP